MNMLITGLYGRGESSTDIKVKFHSRHFTIPG
jgi:hypothetical protein